MISHGEGALGRSERSLTQESPEEKRLRSHLWKALGTPRSLLCEKAADAGNARNCGGIEPARCRRSCSPRGATQGDGGRAQQQLQASRDGVRWCLPFSTANSAAWHPQLLRAARSLRGAAQEPAAGGADAQHSQGDEWLCKHSSIWIYHITMSAMAPEITSCLCMRSSHPKSPRFFSFLFLFSLLTE